MSAVPMRLCIAVAAVAALLSGCAPVVEANADPDATPSPAPTQETTTPPSPVAEAPSPAAPAPPVPLPSGLGRASLLGALPGRETPKGNAASLQGSVFNGAYAAATGASDQRRAREATYVALEWYPIGRLKLWRNPDNGHWGTVTVMRTYQDAKGAWCREFRQTVTLGGEENHDSGAACRGPDGVWQRAG